MDALNKVFSTDISILPDERAVVAKITTSAVDREGHVLVPMGCNTKDYERNPIVLMQHDSFGLPIARCSAIKRFDDYITAKAVFANRPESLPPDEEWVPDIIYDLYKQKMLNAFSVGLIPIEMRPSNDRDVEKYGVGCRLVVSKWSLLEFSAVTIPMNQEAVMTAVGKGMLTAAHARKWLNVDTMALATEATPALIVPEVKPVIKPKSYVFYVTRNP